MKRRLTIIALLLSLLTTLLGLALLYAMFYERTALEETQWRVESADWHGRPLRFVLLSDIHAQSGDGDYLDEIVRRTLDLKPDAVLLLGDYISDSETPMPMEKLAQHLQPLSQVPCYAVLGNHDSFHRERPRVLAMLRSFGAKLVEGRILTLEVEGGQVDIAGIRSILSYGEPRRVPHPRPGRPMLLLSHDPVGLEHAHPGTTAVLAGHTHGGQICLPWGRPLVRPDSHTPWGYMSGEVRYKGIPLYVTRGLGTSTYAVRLFCRPELTLVELVAAGQ